MLLVGAECAINSLDYSVDYTNANFAREFTLPFLLENGLNASDFMRISFPFKLHDTVNPNGTVVNLTTELSSLGESGCIAISASAVNTFIFQPNEAPYIYYLQILNDEGQQRRQLDKNIWYQLKFKMMHSTLPTQTQGFQDPIKIATISAMDSDALVYESNNAIYQIEFTPSPNNSLNASVNITASNKNSIDGIFNSIFAIQPTVNITPEARVRILMINSAFTFNGASCSSVSQSFPYDSNGTTLYSTFPALSKASYSCVIGKSFFFFLFSCSMIQCIFMFQ